jgi:PPOX class probable F420-dependent enzyme
MEPAMSNPLAESRPAERLAVDPIAWLTTAGADGQPQSSPVWFYWDGSTFWLRTQVTARKVKNIRVNPKVAIHLADDGNGGDIVSLEGTAELPDGWPDDVESAYLAKYDEAIRTAIGTTFEQLRIDYPVTVRIRPTRTRTW